MSKKRKPNRHTEREAVKQSVEKYIQQRELKEKRQETDKRK
jgi:hypothetical protein